MAELRHGRITVQIPDNIEIPAQAGSLSEDEVRAIPKARAGLGQACSDAAESWADVPSFVVPGLTADDLQKSGQVAEDIDHVVAAVEVLLNKLKQANLLIDADAWEKLRKVNDQLKAQGKHNPELFRIFKRLTEFMSTRSSGSSNGSPPAAS